MTRKIDMIHGYVVLVDDADYEAIAEYGWCPINVQRKTAYASATINNTHVYMHRFILGVTDSKIVVHHRNRNGLDNRRTNLKVMTNAEHTRMHSRLRQRKTASGYRGVTIRGLRYGAIALIDRKPISLGGFDTPEEAAYAYDCFVLERLGNNAFINGITEKQALEARAIADAKKQERDDNMAAIAAQIKGARLAHGLTQKEVAMALAVDHSYISYLERGERRLLPRHTQALADLLGLHDDGSANLNVIEDVA